MSENNQGAPKPESKLKKNIVRLLLLTCCGSVIYGLPYFRWLFYDTFIEIYQLSNEQLGMLGSAYGLFGLISYLLGGVLADRVSAKVLIYGSLLATGLAGLVHYFTTSYYVLLALYALWGLTSLLTFWPALIKAIRLTGNSHEQSRVFGIFEGGRGVVNTINDTIAVAIFGLAGTGVTAAVAGFKAALLYFSIITIVLGVLCIFVLKDEKTMAETDETSKFKWSNVKTALKLPAVWLVSLIMCCTYAMNMSYSYFNPFATNVFGASAVLGAVLMALAQYVRPIASPVAGFMADKLGRANMMMVGFAAMAVGTLGILVLPQSAGIIVLCVLCAIVYIAMYMNYGVVFSLMDDGGIPLNISGTAIGIVCTVGYLPEVICPLVAGKILDSNEGASGYQIYFGAIIALLVVGFITTIFWKRKFNSKKGLPEEAVSEVAQPVE